jgi:hypothetical protein
VPVLNAQLRFRRGFVENLGRKDLPALDEAASYAQFRSDGETMESTAKLAQKTKTHVYKYLLMHDHLCDGAKALLDPNLDEDKRLTVSAAVRIAGSRLSPGMQLEIAHETINRELSLQDLNVLVSVKASAAGYSFGGQFRKASDGYALYKSLLKRTTNSVNRFLKLDVANFYTDRVDSATRKPEDIRELRVLKDKIDRLIAQIQKV